MKKMFQSKLACLLILSFAYVASGQNIITTIAGDGTAGFRDTGQATSAQLNYPNGVSADTSGNVFIAHALLM